MKVESETGKRNWKAKRESKMGKYGKIEEWIGRLGEEAGEDSCFLETFTKQLFEEPEIREEFAYYMETKEFLCGAKIGDYTVVDIMVWQIDHFKAGMDRGMTGMKENSSKMVLRAFDTMLKMKKNPEKYMELMRTETGTDYPGKY